MENTALYSNFHPKSKFEIKTVNFLLKVNKILHGTVHYKHWCVLKHLYGIYIAFKMFFEHATTRNYR
jgi:hypothetical protein